MTSVSDVIGFYSYYAGLVATIRPESRLDRSHARPESHPDQGLAGGRLSRARVTIAQQFKTHYSSSRLGDAIEQGGEQRAVTEVKTGAKSGAIPEVKTVRRRRRRAKGLHDTGNYG